jgi:hypothetical protein
MSDSTNIVPTEAIDKPRKKQVSAIQAHFDTRFEETNKAIERVLSGLAMFQDSAQERSGDGRSEDNHLKDMALVEQRRQHLLLLSI